MESIFRSVRYSVFLLLVLNLFISTSKLYAQWVPTNGPTEGLSYDGVRCLIVSDSILFAGSGVVGVSRTTDNGASWKNSYSAGLSISTNALTISGTNLFAGTTDGVFRSIDNGESWTSSGLTSSLIYSLAASGENVFAGTQGNGLFRSTDNGASWTPVNSGLTNTYILSLAVSGTNLFAGTQGSGVFRSTDDGASWVAVNTGLTNTFVTTLFALGTDLFAGTPDGAFRSANYGTSWHAIKTGLEAPYVYAFAGTGMNLFAGTGGIDGGVFHSTYYGDNWTDVSTGLTDTYVFAVAISDGNLFAGTGNGVWRRPLAEMIPTGCTPVTIATQPQNQTVPSGGTATLNITINGDGPFSYAWYKNGIQISGTNSPSYTTIPLSASDNGSIYKCIITNCSGNNRVESENAILTVTGEGCTPVTIMSQSQNKTVASGGSATFSVTTDGTGPFTYAWYKNNSQIPGANSSSYTTGTLTAADNGSAYKCIITNCNSTKQIASSSAVLTVTGETCIPVSITSQPQGYTVPDGSKALLSVSVDGTAPFTYSWYKNNVQIPGAEKPYYVTDLLSSSDDGSIYKCIITNCNNANQLASEEAVLAVRSSDTYIAFHHQIPDNPVFSKRRLLFDSRTSIAPPKICADGSNSTIIKFVNIGSTVMESLNFRIKESINENDAENYGAFGPIERYAPDSIVCTYTHPLVINNDSYKRTITLQVYNSNEDQVIEEIPLEIYRAPVLMVHGLWSDASTFDEMENKLFVQYYPSTILRKANYQATNDRSFSENKDVISNEINWLMWDALSGGYSCGKVDVIGHSMGGLLSRVYIQSNNYKNNINRLITMNTPHSGSQLANILLKGGLYDLSLIATAKGIFQEAGSCVDCGAVNDLQVDSKAIQDLRVREISAPPVPKHSIVTTASASQKYGRDVLLANVLKSVLRLSLSSYNSLFGSEAHDLIVPLSSQIGGLAVNHTHNLTNISHMTSTSDDDNINDVAGLLKQSPKNSTYFTTAPFSPPVLEERRLDETLAKSNAVKITDSSAVVITTPPNGTVVLPGQTINTTIISQGDVSKILFAAATEQGNIFSEILEDSSGIFSYVVPTNAAGKVNVIAIGSGESGSVGIDSIQLNVTVSASLDSISVYPKQVFLPNGQTANISIRGYYNDGMIRDISNDPNVRSSSTDPSVVKTLTPVSISADSIGLANVNIEYFEKKDHMSIEVLPVDAFVTGVGLENNERAVREYVLYQNYPNPFNPNTTIKYSIPQTSHVKLQIYDILGREVATLVNEVKSTGTYIAIVNAVNMASGVYFYRLRVGNFVETKKFILLK